MANPQTPFTGAGAGANILTPNSNASNLKPITKIRLLPSKPMLTPPTTTGTTTPNPGTKPKSIKLKLKASSSSSSASSAASRRRKLHRHQDVAGSRRSSEPVNRVDGLRDAHPRVTSNGTSQNLPLEIRIPLRHRRPRRPLAQPASRTPRGPRVPLLRLLCGGGERQPQEEAEDPYLDAESRVDEGE
ncbi:hypothetical protein CSIM01_12591 [Colletotrichum simmondsii]|uniref:Uncharacterized protein n=1 Tax=Colletotrichum simmondsii TaxID=703756 RepID=A0A135T6E6_9PEZI|nr:hypothetical protein CSIM01_12591 [Colletotrichum simmondsii]